MKLRLAIAYLLVLVYIGGAFGQLFEYANTKSFADTLTEMLKIVDGE